MLASILKPEIVGLLQFYPGFDGFKVLIAVLGLFLSLVFLVGYPVKYRKGGAASLLGDEALHAVLWMFAGANVVWALSMDYDSFLTMMVLCAAWTYAAVSGCCERVRAWASKSGDAKETEEPQPDQKRGGSEGR